MADEVAQSYQTGKTLYFVLRNRESQPWHTLSGNFQAYQTANFENYDIAMTEQGTASAMFVGTFPAAIPAGAYLVEVKEQTGGSVAETDPTVQHGRFDWNGSAIYPMSDNVTSGQYSENLPVQVYQGEMVQNFPFKLVSSIDESLAFTSGVVSGQISKDGGAFAALQSGAFTEIGLGFYRTTLTSGDLNADTVAIQFSAEGVSGGTARPNNQVFVLQKR